MKTYLTALLSFLIALTAPVFALAALDVTLSESSVVSVGGYSLVVSGSANIDSIQVDTSSFSVQLSPGSSLTVTSADRKAFTTSPTTYTTSQTCSASQSLVTVGMVSGPVTTVTITPSSSNCTLSEGGIVGGGGGGGGGAPTPVYTVIPGTASGPAAVNLGTAGNFVILAKSGITTTGTTAITGDIGVSPIAATAMTGFGLTKDSSNKFSTSALVTGKVYAADYTVPTPTTMTTAISDMETAYTNAAGRTNPAATELGAGNIGGMTLAPGLYKWGTNVTIPTNVTLSGGANDVWVFQIAGNLSIASAGNVASGIKVLLAGGARASNIFWQVGGLTGATLGTYSTFNGNILSTKQVIMQTGAVLNGRALAQTQVTLNASTVSVPVASSASSATATASSASSVSSSVATGSSSSQGATVTQTTTGQTTTKTVSTPSGVTVVITKSLKLGSENSEVKALQQALATDKTIYPEGKITGYYGLLTRNAIIRFQKKYGIDPVGYVGPLTRKKLNEVYGTTSASSASSAASSAQSSTTSKAQQIQAIQTLINQLLEQAKAMQAKQAQ